MNERKLSVIMPVYNAAALLPETLSCLYAQTFLTAFPDAMEILAVNDASTDESLRVLKEAEAAHPALVRVIDLPVNRGPGGARNAALEEAKGEYIGFMDSDDTVDPAMYEKLYRAATADGGYDIADGGVQDDNAQGVIRHFISPGLTGPLDAAGKNLLLSDVGYLWSRIYRRGLLNDPPVRFREGVVSEDLDFLSEVIARAASVTAVDDVLYRYHDIPESASKRDAEVKFFETTVLAMRAVYERLSVLPDYHAFRPGAEYTICRLAVETLRTIAGYEVYQAVTPDFAAQLREILKGELQRMIRLPAVDNPITRERLSDEDIALLRNLIT